MKTPEIRQELLPDGSTGFHWESGLADSTAVPPELITSPPSWLKALLQRSASYPEVVSALGERARQVRTARERQSLVRIATKLAGTHAGRRALDRILDARFVDWLDLGATTVRLWLASIVLYANTDMTPPSAMLAPWNDEYVWPEQELLLRSLNQNISGVWLGNHAAFPELYLFDGPDLQGRMTRFARIPTPVKPLTTWLDDSSLNNQARSLLACHYNAGGRRFLASDVLRGAAEFSFANIPPMTHWGTTSLVKPPLFFWDGYENYLLTKNPADKVAWLRIHWEVQISDLLYGTTNALITTEARYQRIGGQSSIHSPHRRARSFIPQPWAGDFAGPGSRWNSHLPPQLMWIAGSLAEPLSTLAGTTPGIIRIAPGKSAVVPPANGHWGIIEVGTTLDEATVVFLP